MKDILDYPMRVSSLVFNSLTLIFGVPGNVFVLYVAGIKMKRTVNTVWFVNLAISDLLCCLSIPFNMVDIFLPYHWLYGSALCKILTFVVDINMFASIFTLNLISLDRFAQVMRPVWAQNHRSLLLARLSCAAGWFLALLLSFPFIILEETLPNVNIKYCYHFLPDKDNFIIYGRLGIIRFVFGFLIPLICITACYGFIAHKLGQSQFRSGRALRIMLAVIVAFFLCWLPYHAVDLITMYGGKSVSLAAQTVDQLAISLAHLNSCLNPILYAFMGQDFKNKAKRSLRHVFERAFSEEEPQKPQSTQLQQIV